MPAEFAVARFEITKSADAEEAREFEGIASTMRPDRFEDVVIPKGARFNLPIPFLDSHDRNKQIGWITDFQVGDDAIFVKGNVAKDSGLDYVETAWKKLKAGFLRGLSLSFAPKAIERGKGGRGKIYKLYDVLETSAVTIPANGDASITVLRSLDQPARNAATRDPAPGDPPKPGETAARTNPNARGAKGQAVKTLQDLIDGARARMVEIESENDAYVVKSAEGANTEDDDAAADARVADAAKLATDIARFEAMQGQRSAPGTRTVPGGAVAVVNRDGGGGGGGGGDTRILYARGAAKREAAELLFRLTTVKALAHVHESPLDEVCKSFYPRDNELAAVIKEVSNPALTTVAGWAQELVATAVDGFLQLLEPQGLYARLAGMGQKYSFGPGRGNVKIPNELSDPNLSGAFVGEGAPIRVGKLGFSSKLLQPHKVAVIASYSRELMENSTPNIETVIKRRMVSDTKRGIDKALIDNVAESQVRPAGLMFGVTPVASAGNDAAGISADIDAIASFFEASGYDGKIVLLMNPKQARGLGSVQVAGIYLYRDMVRNGGVDDFAILTSTAVPDGTVIAVGADVFASATGDSPQWLTSNVATVHEDSGTPFTDTLVTNASVKPIVAGTPATPVRSYFQTDTLGTRMIMPLSWAVARDASVFALSGVAWGKPTTP